MNANEARETAVEPRRVSPTALRLLFVLAAVAAVFFLGTAAAEADDEGGSPADSSSQASSGEEQSSDKDRESATLVPPSDGGPSEAPAQESRTPSQESKTPEPQSDGTNVAPTEAPADDPQKTVEATPATTPESGESPSVQGETPHQTITDTTHVIARGVERGVAPTVAQVEESARKTVRELESLGGKDGHIARTVASLEPVVDNVRTLVEQTVQPVESAVRDLTVALAPTTMTRIEPLSEERPDAGTALPVATRAESSAARRAKPVVRNVAVPRDVTTSTLDQAPRTVGTGAASDADSASASSGTDALVGGAGSSMNATSGGSGGGATAMSFSAVLSTGILFLPGVVRTIARADSVCPRSVGSQPGVAPD